MAANSAASPLRCLITGGNTGVGFEVAKQLLQRGHEVMIACRDSQRAQQATQQLQQHVAASAATTLPTPSSSSSVTSVQCDLSSFESVRACAAAVQQRWPQLDVLVCNAAVIPSPARRTADSVDEQLQVNHLSHVLLADLLLPSLVRSAAARRAAAAAGTAAGAGAAASSNPASISSRIVVVGSGQHAQVPAGWDDPAKLRLLLPNNSCGGGADAGSSQQQQQDSVLPPMQLYALTKLCNLWFARHLSSRVLPAAEGKVMVNVVSPGFIPTTDLGRHMTASNFLSRIFMKYVMCWAPFAVTLKEGGSRVVAVCLGKDDGGGDDGSTGSGSRSGQYFVKHRAVPPSPAAQDDRAASECWRLSAEAVGLPVDSFGGLPALPAGKPPQQPESRGDSTKA